MKGHLAKIVALIFSRTDTEATAFPFWYVAEKSGFGRIAMVSKGIWFSREQAEEHLRAKAHRYGKRAFVYCDSAHDSYGGLRELYALARKAKDELESDLPEHRLEGYQHFLGRIADVAGCSGSPTMDEVLARVAMLRNYAEKQAGQDWRGPEPSHIRDAKEALGWRK